MYIEPILMVNGSTKPNIKDIIIILKGEGGVMVKVIQTARECRGMEKA